MKVSKPKMKGFHRGNTTGCGDESGLDWIGLDWIASR